MNKQLQKWTNTRHQIPLKLKKNLSCTSEGYLLLSFTTELKKRRNLHTDKNKICCVKNVYFGFWKRVRSILLRNLKTQANTANYLFIS